MINKPINGPKAVLEGLVLLLTFRGCSGCVSDILDKTGFSESYQPSKVICKDVYGDTNQEIIVRKEVRGKNRDYVYTRDERGNYFLLTQKEFLNQIKNKLEEK